MRQPNHLVILPAVAVALRKWHLFTGLCGRLCDQFNNGREKNEDCRTLVYYIVCIGASESQETSRYSAEVYFC